MLEKSRVFGLFSHNKRLEKDHFPPEKHLTTAAFGGKME